MLNSRTPSSRAALFLLVSGLFFAAVGVSAKPLAKPAEIKIAVAPGSPGGQAKLTLQLEPVAGVQINRYPKIKLSVPEHEGLIAAGEASIGNSAPPKPDQKESNYYETVDPLELDLDVDSAAPTGRHEIEGKLVYFYCVKASGFCAPARVPVTITLEVQ